MFPALFLKYLVLRAGSIQPNFRLRFLSHRCASTDNICKQQTHVFETMNGYESFRPKYKKVVVRCRSHILKTQIQISKLRTDVFRLRFESHQLRSSRLRIHRKSIDETKIRRGQRTTTKLRISRGRQDIAFVFLTSVAPFRGTPALVGRWSCLPICSVLA